jgi:hypothetical protein
VSSKDGRSPRAIASMERQTSTDTTASDTSSSDGSYIILDAQSVPNNPCRRSRWSWRRAFTEFVTRLHPIPNGTETIRSTSSSESGSGSPSYVMGCGIRM